MQRKLTRHVQVVTTEENGSEVTTSAHTNYRNLPLFPIEEGRERPKEEEEEDKLGIQEVLKEGRNETEHILGGCDCNKANPLHSTATESELPTRGTEQSFVANGLGKTALNKTKYKIGRLVPTKKEELLD